MEGASHQVLQDKALTGKLRIQAIKQADLSEESIKGTTKTIRIKIMTMKEVLKDLEHSCLHLEAKTTARNLRALTENGIHENTVSSIGGRVL